MASPAAARSISAERSRFSSCICTDFIGNKYHLRATSANHRAATEDRTSPSRAAIPDEFIDRFAVVGPVEHCISRLAELVEAGAERLVVVPGSRGADSHEVSASLERLAGEVLPALR
ncbi:MAG: LLM class flavin-dependent oxidoreductase [Deltaproteobacteria bacterium]|nr:LLM class flavin-dependent oxidoreductase [Deltaproteobacteria bacterium]